MNWNFYTTPWRLLSLYLGTGLLCIGADIYQMPDWDAGVSFLMAILCYLTAPWAVHVLRNREWKHIVLAVFLSILTVDISYNLYNGFLEREHYPVENFLASMPLYWLMGVFWYYGADIWQALLRLYAERQTHSTNP